jgi:hypothetical protein
MSTAVKPASPRLEAGSPVELVEQKPAKDETRIRVFNVDDSLREILSAALAIQKLGLSAYRAKRTDLTAAIYQLADIIVNRESLT